MKAKNIVRVTQGAMEGKTGVILRIDSDTEMVCVILTKGWDHGIWFNKSDLKVIGVIK